MAAAAMAIVLACDHSKASPNPAPPNGTDRPAGDERQIHPVDARAVLFARHDGKLLFGINFSKERGPDVVDRHWIGMFMADEKEIPGSKFKMTQVGQSNALAEITADELPSLTVRLFPPGYRGRF